MTLNEAIHVVSLHFVRGVGLVVVLAGFYLGVKAMIKGIREVIRG